jgi:hypothetical protein
MSDEPDKSPDKRRKSWDKSVWLEAYAEHGTVTAACKVVGISRETAYQHRKKNEEFAAAWDREENAVTDKLEKTLVEVALDFTHRGQVRALDIALKARRPSVYRESLNVKHGGKVGVAVEIEEGVDEAIDGLLAENDRLTERLAQLEAKVDA